MNHPVGWWDMAKVLQEKIYNDILLELSMNWPRKIVVLFFLFKAILAGHWKRGFGRVAFWQKHQLQNIAKQLFWMHWMQLLLVIYIYILGLSSKFDRINSNHRDSVVVKKVEAENWNVAKKWHVKFTLLRSMPFFQATNKATTPFRWSVSAI